MKPEDIREPADLAYAIRKKYPSMGTKKQRNGFNTFCELFCSGDWSPTMIKVSCYVSISTARNWLDVAKKIAPGIVGEARPPGNKVQKPKAGRPRVVNFDTPEQTPVEPVDFTSSDEIKSALVDRAKELFNTVSTPGELKQITDLLASINPELKMLDPLANKNTEILIGKNANYDDTLTENLRYLAKEDILPNGMVVLLNGKNLKD